jgi:hypothetical protein
MTWNAPKTFVANTVLSARDLNDQIRDNQQELMAAKATLEGGYFLSDGPNMLVERRRKAHTLAAWSWTASTTYADPSVGGTGPIVTMETGSNALIWIKGEISNSGTSDAYMSVAVTGNSVIAASDTYSLAFSGATKAVFQASYGFMMDTLTPGTNTFTVKYRASAGTSYFVNRQLSVFPM